MRHLWLFGLGSSLLVLGTLIAINSFAHSSLQRDFISQSPSEKVQNWIQISQKIEQQIQASSCGDRVWGGALDQRIEEFEDLMFRHVQSVRNSPSISHEQFGDLIEISNQLRENLRDQFKDEYERCGTRKIYHHGVER